MFVALWEYEVKQGCEKRFESVYGPVGEWARLFGRDAKYRGTRLLRDAVQERVYLTLDFWTSHRALAALKKKHSEAYLALDQTCEELTVREKHLGSFESFEEPVRKPKKSARPKSR
jgi:hypothetical protein